MEGNTNSGNDVFVHDTADGTTTLVSVNSAGVAGNDRVEDASISGDGRYVAFQSPASNLVEGNTNGTSDIFVRDTVDGTTRPITDLRGKRGLGATV